MRNKIKKLGVVVWIATLILLLVFFWIFIRDERPVVYHYNKGNDYYKEGSYALAEDEYRSAFKQNKSEKRDCDIRVNLALAMVAPFDRESITKDTIDDAIDSLKAARDILLENGCAMNDPDVGHDADAQLLKEEIDEYLKELEEQKQEYEQEQKEQNADSGDEQDENENKEDGNEKQRQQDIQDMLENIQKEGAADRDRSLDIGDSLNSYEYYDGASW